MTTPNQLPVAALRIIERTLTTIATHHAQPRILHNPIATTKVTRPKMRMTAPKTAARPAIHAGIPAPANAVAPRAATPIKANPATISPRPPSPDRIARIATPSGRFGGAAPYMPGGGIEGGMLLGGIAAGGEPIDKLPRLGIEVTLYKYYE